MQLRLGVLVMVDVTVNVSVYLMILGSALVESGCAAIISVNMKNVRVRPGSCVMSRLRPDILKSINARIEFTKYVTRTFTTDLKEPACFFAHRIPKHLGWMISHTSFFW